MGYHYNIKTVRLELSNGFNFFGDSTKLSVVVYPDLGGANSVTHTGTRTIIADGSALRAEPSTSIDVPTPTGGGWVTDTGSPATGWGYVVTVTATAPGRSSVVWRHTITVPVDTGRVILDPASGGNITAQASAPTGALVNPETGGIAAGTREDTSVGSRIYVQTPNGERRIYADTGFRSVGANVINGFTASRLVLQRLGNMCFLSVVTLAGTAATASEFYKAPAGFRPHQSLPFSRPGSLTTTAGVTRFVSGRPDGDLYITGTYNDTWHGQLSWVTNDPWPTALPGAAL